ncbi:hypothetical protein DPMN_063681 [Dreissena polymorpha]|uniref:Uncharacterized protein n=1 Tax=Dreissena polymorpha TaxID=45954 RepID=A0A9D4CAZ3_DREPO|nr:hypothetical protein DPMN_063681 [Dreissena polymorpha]
MQDFTDLAYTKSPQLNRLIKRDASDIENMQTQITSCSPYTEDPTLKNIVNLIEAGSDVNVHAFQEVGN